MYINFSSIMYVGLRRLHSMYTLWIFKCT